MREIIKMKKAFTLAEVLLVLAVIGVVAALTIPTLIQKVNNDQYISRLKKTYSLLSQATNMLYTENNGLDNLAVWSPDNQNSNIMNTFSTKLNVIKSCYGTTGCFANTMYKQVNNSAGTSYDTSLTSRLVLADGSTVAFSDSTGSCNFTPNSGNAITPLLSSTCAQIYVDVNGPNPPNVNGRDLFTFWVTKTGLVPMGSANDGSECTTIGLGCANKVLTENRMNY